MSRRGFAVLIAIASSLAAVATILILTARDEPPRPASADDPSAGRMLAVRPEVVRDCASRVEGEGEGARLTAHPGADLVAGPIVFYGLREWGRAAKAKPSEAFRSRAGEYAPIKTITEVAADSVVTVAVAPASQRRAALLYRWSGGRRVFGFRLSEGQRVIRFRSCPASKRRFSGRGRVGPRTQYNGGFLFSQPQCLLLDVLTEGTRKPRRYVVPIGRSDAECLRK